MWHSFLQVSSFDSCHCLLQVSLANWLDGFHRFQRNMPQWIPYFNGIVELLWKLGMIFENSNEYIYFWTNKRCFIHILQIPSIFMHDATPLKIAFSAPPKENEIKKPWDQYTWTDIYTSMHASMKSGFKNVIWYHDQYSYQYRIPHTLTVHNGNRSEGHGYAATWRDPRGEPNQIRRPTTADRQTDWLTGPWHSGTTLMKYIC